MSRDTGRGGQGDGATHVGLDVDDDVDVAGGGGLKLDLPGQSKRGEGLVRGQ
jgi:hypothetical protein